MIVLSREKQRQRATDFSVIPKLEFAVKMPFFYKKTLSILSLHEGRSRIQISPDYVYIRKEEGNPQEA